MSSRDEYVRKLQAKLEEWNSDIDTLTARAGEVTGNLRQEYEEQIAALREKQGTTRQKLEELQHAGEEAWEDLKAGVDLAREAITAALDSARARFRH